MTSLIEYLQDQFRDNDDFFLQEEIVLGTPVLLMGLKSIIDVPRTYANLAFLAESNHSSKGLVRFPGKRLNDPEAVVSSILAGKVALCEPSSSAMMIVDPIPKELDRSIQMPNSESIILGNMDSFIEEFESNIGLIRKQFNSNQLRIKIHEVGSGNKTNLAMIYHEECADHKLVSRIKDQIRIRSNLDIRSLQEVTLLLGFSRRSLIAKFKTTEIPGEAVYALEQGKVILFVDRIPFALVLPNMLWDAFAIGSDRHLPLPIMLSVRAIRVVGAFTTIILPALYVALVAVNPEVLRLQLALSVAQSREGVPYPAAVETLVMLILLELILEGSVRLPRSVSTTITMVGGIILGEAVVSAELVSNLLIIVIAATTIATSTIVGIQYGYLIRSLKYVTVILAAIFGVTGIFAGVVIIFGLLAGENTYGISYVRLPFIKDEARND